MLAGHHVLREVAWAWIQPYTGRSIALAAGAVAGHAVRYIELLAGLNGLRADLIGVDRATSFSWRSNCGGERHQQWCLAIAQQRGLHHPIAGHGEEWAAGLKMAGADGLGIDLGVAHIHADHREAQAHRT